MFNSNITFLKVIVIRCFICKTLFSFNTKNKFKQQKQKNDVEHRIYRILLE